MNLGKRSRADSSQSADACIVVGCVRKTTPRTARKCGLCSAQFCTSDTSCYLHKCEGCSMWLCEPGDDINSRPKHFPTPHCTGGTLCYGHDDIVASYCTPCHESKCATCSACGKCTLRRSGVCHDGNCPSSKAIVVALVFIQRQCAEYADAVTRYLFEEPDIQSEGEGEGGGEAHNDEQQQALLRQVPAMWHHPIQSKIQLRTSLDDTWWACTAQPQSLFELVSIWRESLLRVPTREDCDAHGVTQYAVYPAIASTFPDRVSDPMYIRVHHRYERIHWVQAWEAHTMTWRQLVCLVVFRRDPRAVCTLARVCVSFQRELKGGHGPGLFLSLKRIRVPNGGNSS